MSEQQLANGDPIDPANPPKPVKVPAFSDMDDDAQAAHLKELHHPGTVDSARHFMTHLVGIVPVPHVHAKRTVSASLVQASARIRHPVRSGVPSGGWTNP